MPAPARPTKVVYVIGAGLSAGLGFPTISDLLHRLWPRLVAAGHADGLEQVIRFHHPRFDPTKQKTFPNVETLLSEMQANAALFDYSRPAVGGFTLDELMRRQENLLFELAKWFHELKAEALHPVPGWLTGLVQSMRDENAQVVSFNWDLVLDELLFGDALDGSSYALTPFAGGPRLIKPHGSLNWYGDKDARRLPDVKRFPLCGVGPDALYAFRPFRAPLSTRHRYMPVIVPPVYAKTFDGEPFRSLWRETVSVIGSATEVRFLGYSLPDADFHARFIVRCGFHNQTHGAIAPGGGRLPATGPARVTIVDPWRKAHARIKAAVGRPCQSHRQTIAEWIDGGGLD
ncbi:MAG: hypothetical protein IE910_00175 [Brevundimonas sp.]|nr:hypothetical protein [Brevundimonas sp.]